MRDRAAVVGTVVGTELEARFRNREPGGFRRAVTALASDPQLASGMLVGPNDTVLVATEILLDGRPIPERLRQAVGWRRTADGSLRPGTEVTPDGQHVIGIFPVRMPVAGGQFAVSRPAALVLEYDLSSFKARALASAASARLTATS